MKSTLSISEFDDWCRSVPALNHIGERHWANFDPANISYPESDLSALEEIEPRSYWFKHRNDVIASIVSQHPPDGTIIDIGGGNGFVSQALTTAGFPTVVIEPDQSGALAAQRRGLPVIQAAFQNLEIPPGTLSAAGMFDVLEHIEDDRGALVRLRNLLVPDGIIYIAVPALNALWSNEDVEAGHFKRYSRSHLTRVLRGAGFEPLRATYFFSALVPAVMLLRSLPSLVGLRKGGSTSTNGGEHELPDNAVGALLRKSFAWEMERIARGGDIAVGSSLLVAARAARQP